MGIVYRLGWLIQAVLHNGKALSGDGRSREQTAQWPREQTGTKVPLVAAEASSAAVSCLAGFPHKAVAQPTRTLSPGTEG